jgi:hypothetical protein
VVLSVAAFAALVVMQRPSPAAENGMPGLTYMDGQRVLDNFDKKNANPLIPGDAYNVQTNKRTANGNIEIHEKETDIFYIMDGSATIVGGTAVEIQANPVRPDDRQRHPGGAKPTTSRRVTCW